MIDIQPRLVVDNWKHALSRIKLRLGRYDLSKSRNFLLNKRKTSTKMGIVLRGHVASITEYVEV
jgi:hypothetical protein